MQEALGKSEAPLSSGDLAKVLIFALTTIPTVVPYLLGSLVVLFVAFGLRMAKRSGDFSHVAVAVKISKWYLALLAAVFVTLACTSYGDEFIGFSLAAIVVVAYAGLLHYLFFVPVRAHRDWVVAHGVFASRHSRQKQSDADIVKTDSARSYSVADELLKWAKLKEDGVVSDAEFEVARQKLLPRE